MKLSRDKQTKKQIYKQCKASESTPRTYMYSTNWYNPVPETDRAKCKSTRHALLLRIKHKSSSPSALSFEGNAIGSMTWVKPFFSHAPTPAERLFFYFASRRTIKDKRIDMGRLNKLYIVAPEVFYT